MLVAGLASCADDRVVAPGDAGAPSLARGFPPWIRMESDVETGLEAVWGTSPNTLFAVGVSGTIQHFDGERWVRQESGVTSALRDVWGTSSDNVWAVGGLGALMHYDGTAWRLVRRLTTTGGTQYQLFGLWGAAHDDIWAVGNGGTAHHYDGQDWTYVNLPTSAEMHGVWGTASDNIFAVGVDGVLLHYNGSTWTNMESPTDIRMNVVHGRGPDDVFAAGSFGVILHFDGERWTEHPQSRIITRAHIRDMWSDGDGNIFAVAWGGTILHHDGERWHLMQTGVTSNIEGIWASHNGRLYAVGALGLTLKGGRGIGHGHRPPGLEQKPVWPLSGSTAADSDSIHAQYGPRALPSGYDFHAGIDLPAPTGTPALSVLPGEVVTVTHWNGTSSAGNNVIVRHESGEATAYLHLDRIDVEVGQWLEAGEQLGTVGRTGATAPHLHLTYFRTLNTNSMDERQSFNPLELLAHGTDQEIGVTFSPDSVLLSVPMQQMRIRTIEVFGENDSRLLDYYEIVRQGSSARDTQLQNDVFMDAGRPANRQFSLTLKPVLFQPKRIVITGIDGSVLVDMEGNGTA